MVAFEDRFWGDKNAGYDVLYHNMKYGNSVSVKVSEFIRERAAVEESYSKSLVKLAKSACSVSQLGSFEPLWGVLRVATDKLATAHHTVVVKLHELGKDVKEYGDKQKERHKAAKEEFSGTAEIVQTMQSMTQGLTKAKENYYARCHEFEKCKKDGTSQKEIEKAELKVKKAGEEYKALVERREIVRNEFHDKMVETSRKFQQIEEEHLKTVIGHLETYIDSHLSGWKMMEEVHTEFRERLRALTIDKLLDQLVRSKGTGLDIPGVITFEEYEEHQHGLVSIENSPSTNNKSQALKPQLPGFPLHKKKKEKKEKKKKKKKEKGSNSSPSNSQGSPEHQQNGPVESPVSEGSLSRDPSFEVDEEGYRIRPPDTESAKSAGGSSDSDSDSDDDDEPKRIQVTIKPVDDMVSQTASVDEIKKITNSLTLSSPSSMRRNLSSSSGLNDGFRSRASTENSRSTSTTKLSRSSDDLLEINLGNHPKNITSPGSDSNLSSSNLSTPTDISSTAMKDIKDADTKGIAAVSTFDSFSARDAFTTSSPASFNIGDPNEGNGNGDEDTPPALPKKKGSHGNNLNVTSDDLNIPPPLPAKRDGAGLQSYQSSSGALNHSSDASKSKTTTLPILMKPPGPGEIPRVGSTGTALARPRPQGAQKKPGLTVTTQPPPSQGNQSSMSYSQELFSLLSDFTDSKDKHDSEDGGPKKPQTPSKVSYVGSVDLTNTTTTTETNSQVMTRAVTTTSIQGLSESQERQENAAGLIRSKTMGSMPTVPSRILSVSHSSPSKEDGLPIAVAFIESVNAFFRGSDHKACMVKVTGDITVSFPASIISQLTSDKDMPSLTFFITGTSSLEQILPNKSLISSEGQKSGGDAVVYKFNMTALASHLKKQTEMATSAYYNIDILKYEVRTSGIQSTPLQLCSYWKCEPTSTNIRVDYRYNPACMSTPSALTNVSIIAPVNGGVTIMQSKPSANWSAENQRAVWILPEISGSKDQDGSLRAKLDLTEGPSTPSRIAVQFSSTGATISKLNFELKSDAYKLSLVKKQIATGRYISES